MTYVLQTFKSPYYFQWDFDVVFSLGYFLSELYYKNLQIHKNITHQNWSDCKSIQANEQLELALLHYVISHINIIKNFTSSFTNFMPLLCLSLLFLYNLRLFKQCWAGAENRHICLVRDLWRGCSVFYHYDIDFRLCVKAFASKENLFVFLVF